MSSELKGADDRGDPSEAKACHGVHPRGMKGLPAMCKASVGKGTLEYVCSGTGQPTIVLVNGAGGPVEAWYKVYAPLEALGTVFAYNRPGVGGSDKPVEAQTGDAVVATLRSLLGHAGLAPPYVLVGHSLGGLHVNLFARRFPHEVSAVVLLDASAPDDVSLMAGQHNWAQRALDALLGKDPLAETSQAEQTARRVADAGPFPDVPLVVVTGGKPAMAWFTPQRLLAGRAQNQRALAALSSRGRQVIATRSGHFPQFSEPQLVVQAVRDAVEAAMDSGGSPR